MATKKHTSTTRAQQPAQAGKHGSAGATPSAAQEQTPSQHADQKMIEVPKDWPCEIDDALVSLEEASGILDLVTEMNLDSGPGALNSVLLTAFSAIGRARRSLIGDETVQS